jgi:hypothetical protein
MSTTNTDAGVGRQAWRPGSQAGPRISASPERIAATLAVLPTRFCELRCPSGSMGTVTAAVEFSR